MEQIRVILAFLVGIIHVSLCVSNFTKPENFYGSEALLDGYCDEAQYFIDAFTLSSEQRLTVEGSAEDVMRQLATINTTG